MAEPIWVLRSVIDAVHDMQLAQHGGATGIRDQGLLDSALARPKNMHAYGETDLCALAAVYAAGIAHNHPYIDGNKRTAFLAAYIFLQINGLQLQADELSATHSMLALASGKTDKEAFADWLRSNV
ncbi:MAG TPA: type II toxin-antitoxin system death-on-curing family toxin [Rhizobiales bacterium]|nr:type II toxin-antitoxin system death-on-curing family toxin [Hyphomicrobiales bacterium]